jgi:hypothetical protein
MKTLTTQQADIINEAAFQADVELRSYSGRAMYGSSCLGVSGSERDSARFLIVLAQQDYDLASDLVDSLRTDSLGMGIITYFTNIGSEGIVADDDDDDDDEE